MATDDENKCQQKSFFNFDSFPTSFSGDLPSEEPRPYKNAREYARALQPWLHQYHIWSSIQAMPAIFSYQMQNCFTQSPFFQPISPVTSSGSVPNGISHPQHTAAPRVAQTTPQNAPQQNLPRNTEGTEYVIPPLWKRVAAEVVDFVVLFYMKIIVTVVVMRRMGYLRDDNILDVQLDFMPMLDLTEVDIDKAFAMTSEIIALEVVNRIFITLFEALCIRRGYGTEGGATPGKRILGMKVVSCDQVIDLRNGKVLVIPAGDIGFISALVRSIIKNFTVAFLFPACFTVFFFQNNRAAYDVLAKTIVVQTQPLNAHRR